MVRAQANRYSPVLGLPLMIIFVILTNILLITSLISILSNTLTRVTEHARDEYLYGYSVFVLEASTSNRLTYFLPPLNLVSLAFRPLRLVMSAEQLRNTRIILLKMTHLPHVLAINLYEKVRIHLTPEKINDIGLGLPKGPERPSALRRSALIKRISMPYPLTSSNREHSLPLEEEPQVEIDHEQSNTTILETDHIKKTLNQLTYQIEGLRKMLEQQERQVQVDG